MSTETAETVGRDVQKWMIEKRPDLPFEVREHVSKLAMSTAMAGEWEKTTMMDEEDGPDIDVVSGYITKATEAIQLRNPSTPQMMAEFTASTLAWAGWRLK